MLRFRFFARLRQRVEQNRCWRARRGTDRPHSGQATGLFRIGAQHGAPLASAVRDDHDASGIPSGLIDAISIRSPLMAVRIAGRPDVSIRASSQFARSESGSAPPNILIRSDHVASLARAPKKWL
jgi:hypothetical protein